MAPHLRYLAGFVIPLLFACNQAGTQQASNSEEINAQAARHDGEVRSGRLESLADELNTQAARTGGDAGRALQARAREDSNAALSVYEAGEAKAGAIEESIRVDRNAAGGR